MTDPITAAVICITATIWLEARGEADFDAMPAVADTIMARAAQRDLSPCDVVNERWQYVTGVVDLEYMGEIEREAYDRARQIAVNAFYGRGLGLDADHFHNGTVRPYWALDEYRVGRIGDHTFYKLGR
jgi:spore germination cell wall hydrolase CwlJ-like protein